LTKRGAEINSKDLLDFGTKAFSFFKKARGWQIELYLERDEFREVAWSDRAPEDTQTGWSQGLALRVIRQGRQGFAFANEISREALRFLWDRAVQGAALAPKDPHRFLAKPRIQKKTFPDILDSSLFSKSIKSFQRVLATQEKALILADPRIKKALRLAIRESRGSSVIMSNQGVTTFQPSEAVSFSAEVLGESGKEVQVAWDFQEARSWKNVHMDRVLQKAKTRLLDSFGGRKLRSGKWQVFFDPRVAVDLLDMLATGLCADNVQHKRSLFRGKRHQKVASSLVSFVDDGLYPDGLATGPYDDEGMPSQTTTLVHKGILKDYLYDTHTAAREQRLSTGNAGRPGLGGAPSPGASNFYMVPGNQSREDLFRDTAEGFWIQDVMGMHTADPVSGDFSVGASGVLLKKGKPIHAVQGVTLAGNLLNLLKNVDGVANDLTWYGALGAPTFRVSGLSVGGS